MHPKRFSLIALSALLLGGCRSTPPAPPPTPVVAVASPAPAPRKIKIGLALGGGAARGFAHIGV
ncbi:MAG: patatin-like phospholipase family protein, partial [Pseudomonadota bacterium]|nr:patatin-like phospholipase family protein [Pseudomonadota bacterium]